MRTILLNATKNIITALYSINLEDKDIQIEKTKENIDGDFTIVIFPFTRFSQKSPAETAKQIAVLLKQQCDEIASYNIINGFLNINFTSEYKIYIFNNLLKKIKTLPKSNSTIMVEFSSPNTNKPLHLGHIRNNLLGDSICRILEKDGNKIVRVNLVNDRGIHICKSMLAWIKWGNDQTPTDEKIKGDKFVGNFYVLFNEKYKEEIENLKKLGQTEEEAKNNAPIMLEAREILKKWENGDPEIINIWNKMNSWVYEGFDKTYKKLSINFDKTYYESQTYLLGKELVNKGLEKNIFEKDPDNSVWIDLTNEGLDRKILLRSDGTTVYMTQDIGTAIKRFEEYNPDKIIYIVGSEQDYHFEVLKKIIAKINADYSKKIEHLSYGMVELPDGKMKSREGTVVDADDLIQEVVDTARKISKESEKINELEDSEKEVIIKKIAIAALKYYILKIDPKKNITYNPQDSIDFNGNTGPFIQYTYARIQSILNKAKELNINYISTLDETTHILDIESKIILTISEFNYTVHDAALKCNPGIIANYAYDLAKTYNNFYNNHSILKENNRNILQLRLMLSELTGKTIKEAMNLLGIEVPDKM